MFIICYVHATLSLNEMVPEAGLAPFLPNSSSSNSDLPSAILLGAPSASIEQSVIQAKLDMVPEAGLEPARPFPITGF
jgi:hypothetical protein